MQTGGEHAPSGVEQPGAHVVEVAGAVAQGRLDDDEGTVVDHVPGQQPVEQLGVARGALVGGAVGPAGPLETVIRISVSTATSRPASGWVAMTVPAGRSSRMRVVGPTRSPAPVRATMASASVAPATSGTVTSPRRVDTVGVTTEPSRASDPGAGT